MIEYVKFENFKALRDTTLPLSRFTLLIGPNGSGKSTAIQALTSFRDPISINFAKTITAGVSVVEGTKVGVIAGFGDKLCDCEVSLFWYRNGGREKKFQKNKTQDPSYEQQELLGKLVDGITIYSLEANAIATPIELKPNMWLEGNGRGLPGVLDRLRDEHPERFEQLNEELGKWLPEFDRILFETPAPGQRAIQLRTREGQHAIKASEISQGTLLAVAILTLAYLPDPPPVVCLEEPGRGIHPRLLRDVRDAIYRLAYPENFGEKRDPVQVIATTHSPYMLDLFRDHPDEIVIAQKVQGNVKFERLSDRADLDEILQDTHLGDAWYSGVLGGVPADK